MSCIHLTLDLPDPDATNALARRIAPHLRAGHVLLLSGEIGAGKTHFARALIQARLAALGRHEDVPSPTFTLVQVYDLGDVDLWHSDLYRLTDPDDAIELGLDEAFETAICLIEWPDRLGRYRPKAALSLQFSQIPGADGRRVVLEGDAPTWDWLPKALEHAA